MNAHILEFSADLRELDRIRAFVEVQARTFGVAGNAVYDVLLAVNELVTNVIVHGYRGTPGALTIELRADGADLVIRLRDWAPPFDPTLASPSGTAKPLDPGAASTIGIHLAHRFTDSITYRSDTSDANELTIIKRGVCAT